VQIVCDHLLRIVLECQEADPTKKRFECGRSDVTPIQHPIKLGAIDQIAFKGRQEDLRCIAKDNHA